jgi:hypothetical protein
MKKMETEVIESWNNIQKSAEFDDYSKFIKIQFAFLPSYKLQKQEFKEEVGKLRSQFIDESNPKYLFNDFDY